MVADQPEDNALPLSDREAKRVSAALLAQPFALLVWVAGIFIAASGRESPPVLIAMGIAFLVNAVAVLLLFGLMVRIAGRSDRSLSRTLVDFNFRIPWSLMLGDLGRKAFHQAGWSPRLLWVQRTVFLLTLIVFVVGFLTVALDLASSSREQ